MQQKLQWVKNSTCLTRVDLGTFYPKPTCVYPRGMAHIDKPFISCLRKVKVSHTYSLPDESCPESLYNAPSSLMLPFKPRCVTPYWLLKLRLWKLKCQFFSTSIPKALPRPFTQPHFAFRFFREKARRALQLVACHSVLHIYDFPNHRRWGSILPLYLQDEGISGTPFLVVGLGKASLWVLSLSSYVVNLCYGNT